MTRDAEASHPVGQGDVRLSGVVLVLAITAGVLGALALIYTTWLAQGENPEQFPVPLASPSEVGAQQLEGDEVVRRYLEALAAGDIEAAAKEGDIGEGSDVLIDNSQNMRQRPHEIAIDEAASEGPTVAASYVLSDEHIEAEYVVEFDEEGLATLAHSASTIVIEAPESDGLPLLVNGIEVPVGEPLAVVPGVYELSTGLRMIEYAADESFRIDMPDAETRLISPTPQLSSLGDEALRAAVRRSLEECFASTELSPAGCPQHVAPTGEVEEGSVQWRLVGNPLSEAEAKLSSSEPTRGEILLNLRYTVTYTVAGEDAPMTTEGSDEVIASSTMLTEQGIAVEWHQ